MLFSELVTAVRGNYLVRQLLYVKRCFGGSAAIGIVTSPGKVDRCSTIAGLVAKGHVPTGLEWVDQYLVSIPTVCEIPTDDFVAILSRYSDGGPPCP